MIVHGIVGSFGVIVIVIALWNLGRLDYRTASSMIAFGAIFTIIGFEFAIVEYVTGKPMPYVIALASIGIAAFVLSAGIVVFSALYGKSESGGQMTTVQKGVKR